MPQKLNFYNYLLDYPLFFNYTQLALSSTLNTLDLSFTKNLNWQFHSSTPAKSAFKKLGVLWRLRPFFSPSQLLALYMGLKADAHRERSYAMHRMPQTNGGDACYASIHTGSNTVKLCFQTSVTSFSGCSHGRRYSIVF